MTHSLNYPQSVVFETLNELMFVKVSPSDSFEKIKEELVNYDREIVYYSDSNIRQALDKWLDTKDLT